MPKTKLKCHLCQKEFYDWRSQRRGKYCFCSKKCKYKWNKTLTGYWKGKKMPKSACEKMKQNHAHSWLGRKHTEEWKKLMSKKLKGKNNPMFGKVGKLNPFYGKTHTVEVRKKLSAMRMGKITVAGKDHPNWLGGKSFEPYTPDFNGALKRFIRKRDNFTCQVCGVPEKLLKGKLTCHHIDYDKNNLDYKNLLSLCRSCHAKTNYNRQYWQKRFSKA